MEVTKKTDPDIDFLSLLRISRERREESAVRKIEKQVQWFDQYLNQNKGYFFTDGAW